MIDIIELWQRIIGSTIIVGILLNNSDLIVELCEYLCVTMIDK